jgi:mono/diheme cytochrome c family protein
MTKKNRNPFLWSAALSFAAMTSAIAAEDTAVDAGANVYEMQCSGCHGPRLRSPGTSFDLRELKEEERARFETAVMDGKNMMPAWRGTISDEQLGQLWAYIREYAYE